jgi:hypothetical protein
MRLRKMLISFSLVLITALVFPRASKANSGINIEASKPTALCLPGIYLDSNPECAILGPAAHMTDIATIEAEIAAQPDRFPSLPESFGETEFNYFRARDESSLIFSSFDTALANTSAYDSLYEGYTFAAYTKEVTQDGRKYFQLSDGRWMRSSAVQYYANPNRFLGVMPEDSPTLKFGWVLKDTPTLKAPGYYEPLSGNVIPRYTLVEVFDEIRLGLSDWYMIAPDEWIYMTQVALVYPAEGPPEGVKNGRWIEINIFEQTLSVYENNQMIFATLVTSGSNRNYTRPGLFKIYEKLESTDMAGDIGQEGAYFLMDVPWTMYFDERRALHAEYWHDHLGYKSSHGCVNMSFPDSDWLFQWAEYGDWVYAWDPSGNTPEDPKLFTQHLDDI